MDVIINHYYSDCSSYSYLLDSAGVEIARFTHDGESACDAASTHRMTLTPGTYTVVSESVDNYDINLSIHTPAGFYGDQMAGAIPLIYNTSFHFEDTRDLSLYAADYTPGYKDVYYKLTLAKEMQVYISMRNSYMLSPRLTLLNNTGTVRQQDLEGKGVSGVLPIGTYYIVCAGNPSNGQQFRLSIDGIYEEPVYQSIAGINHVLTITPTEAIKQAQDVKTATYSKAMRNYEYFDGLGRSLQTVQQNFTPQCKDLVIQTEYNSEGLPSMTWLPYPSNNSTGEHVQNLTQLKNSLKTYYADQYPFDRVDYEKAPQRRKTSLQTSGADWQGKTQKMAYGVNQTSDAIVRYSVSPVGILTKHTAYAAGSLTYTRTEDEDGCYAYEFKDKLDRLVCQRTIDADTYYVYDNCNKLRYVLPPLAADRFINSGTLASDTVLQRYAYYYLYDDNGLCIINKNPGADEEYSVYDKVGKLILLQTGAQRSANKWTFYKYDKTNRIVLQGETVLAGTIEALRQAYKTVECTEEFTTSTDNVYGYTNTSLPLISISVVMLVNYYDSYGFLNLLSAGVKTNLTYSNESGYGSQYTNSIVGASEKGLLTGTLSKLFSDSSKELVSAIYYDDKGNIVQQKESNHLNGYEKSYMAYSFTGKLTNQKKQHSSSYDNATLLYRFTYDHRDRPLATYLMLDGEDEIIETECYYDALGRVNMKDIADVSESMFYDYNLHNQLTKMQGDRFTQNLYYNSAFASATKKYNGNISAMTWYVNAESLTRGYMYTYDNFNRLLKATYGEGATLTSNQNRFNEEVLSYDKQGNIRRLTRNGKLGNNSYGTIDNLSIDYVGNQLNYVNDAVTATIAPGLFHFVDKNNGRNREYQFDGNGNLIQDDNKGISKIAYNYLNQPDKLQFTYGHITSYGYDAQGIKRQAKHVTVSENLQVTPGTFVDVPANKISSSTTTDYCGNVIYENNQLSMIRTLEGFFSKKNGNIEYYYYLRDYLGNNRLVTAIGSQAFQVNHYYPFGGVFGDGLQTNTQPYKYSDKELDTTNGLVLYDFDARQMDPALGRFMSRDPLSNKYYGWSSYAYCMNNPINAIDPDGRSTWVKQNTRYGTYEVFDGDIDDGDYNIYIYTQDKNGNYTVRGESIGITSSITSFYNSDEGSWAAGSIINPTDNSGNKFLEDIFGNNPQMFDDYMMNARNGRKYDFKVTNGTDEAIPKIDIYRGMPIGKAKNGQIVYTSARDIGNIAAGYVAASNGMSWEASRMAFDGYQSLSSGRPTKEGISTVNAEFCGWRIGSNINNVSPLQKMKNLGNSAYGGLKMIWDWMTK